MSRMPLTRAQRRRVWSQIRDIEFNEFYTKVFLAKIAARVGRRVLVDDVLLGRVPEVAHLHVGFRNPDDCNPRLGEWFSSPEEFLRKALLENQLSGDPAYFDDAMEIDLFDPRTQRAEMDAYLVPNE